MTRFIGRVSGLAMLGVGALKAQDAWASAATGDTREAIHHAAFVILAIVTLLLQYSVGLWGRKG